MARGCDFCGKIAATGNRVSHANNITKRRWHPNLKSVRALVNGDVKRMHACTRCLRAGKVTKPPVRASATP